MSEPIWYYARGDVERGPVTSGQIKQLAAVGKLRGDDLVWKEGMEDWTPAGEIPGLLANEKPAPPGDTAVVEKTGSSRRPRPAALSTSNFQHALEVANWGPRLGRQLMILGFLCVVLAKGCDAVGQRYVIRLESIAAMAEESFQDDWDQQRMDLEDEQQALRQEENPDPAEIAAVSEKLRKLNEDSQKAQEQLRRGKWRNQTVAAREAAANDKIWGFWRGAAFVLGTLVLTVGLLGTGLTSDGAERWMCLIMLAIITLSLYLGSATWLPAPEMGN